MTSDENPADVIEQAAQVVFDYKPAAPMVIARALHDAGLLADPADRDKWVRSREQIVLAAVVKRHEAEAEVAELRATVERVRTLHAGYYSKRGKAFCGECGEEYPCHTIQELDGGAS